MQRYVSVEFGGEEKLLRFDFNAIADMEEHFGKGLASIFREENIGFRTVRGLYWAGLRWKERGLTVERTGHLLQEKMEQEGVTIQDLLEPVMEAINKSGFLGAQTEEKKKKGKNPQTA